MFLLCRVVDLGVYDLLRIPASGHQHQAGVDYQIRNTGREYQQTHAGHLLATQAIPAVANPPVPGLLCFIRVCQCNLLCHAVWTEILLLLEPGLPGTADPLVGEHLALPLLSSPSSCLRMSFT